jgi:hypothetical protein
MLVYIKLWKDKLQVALNKTVRFNKNMNPRTSIKHTELSNLGFLNVEDIVKRFCSNYAHNIFNKHVPFIWKIIH